MLNVKETTSYPRGTIKSLLIQAYADFHLACPEYEDENLVSFSECDSVFYDHPDIGKSCSFVSEFDGELCGMCCWDPRNFPKAIIGHNCIIPRFRGQGLGVVQLNAALDILKRKKFETVAVSTGLLDFFVPAQRMYQAAGFRECCRDDLDKAKNKLHALIYYELDLLRWNLLR